jgi:hypothetical protein
VPFDANVIVHIPAPVLPLHAAYLTQAGHAVVKGLPKGVF